VISDHGFSTIKRANDVTLALAAGGIKVTGSIAFDHTPQAGEVLAVQLGGSVLFYVIGHDKDIGRRLVEIVQKTDYAGVIFSRWELLGTFSLERAHIATKDAPDVVMAFRWTPEANRYGAKGMIDADIQRRAGGGTHATLSAYDMHNTLIAAGPDFRKGWVDENPTGNIDLAPTILWILGVPQAVPMDGRMLWEAMLGRQVKLGASTEVLKAANPAAGWEQYLKVSRVGNTEYFDEGNRGAGP